MTKRPLNDVWSVQYSLEVDCRGCNQQIFNRGMFTACECNLGSFRTYCTGCDYLCEVTFCEHCHCGYCTKCIADRSKHEICYVLCAGGRRGYPCVQCAHMNQFDRYGYEVDFDGHDHGNNLRVDCCDHTCPRCVHYTFIRERVVKTILLNVYKHCCETAGHFLSPTWLDISPWRRFGCPICFTYFRSQSQLTCHIKNQKCKAYEIGSAQDMTDNQDEPVSA